MKYTSGFEAIASAAHHLSSLCVCDNFEGVLLNG